MARGGFYPEWLYPDSPENALRLRLRQNQIENTPGGVPFQSGNLLRTRPQMDQPENLLRGPSRASIQSARLAPRAPVAPDDETGLKAIGAKPAGYKATAEQRARDDFEGVDQFTGRRLGSGAGSITETAVSPQQGSLAAQPRDPLSTPMVGRKGMGGNSAMYGVPERSFGENLIRGVRNAILGPSKEDMARTYAENAAYNASKYEEVEGRWKRKLDDYEAAGVPKELVTMARAAGSHEGGQMISQYLGTAAKADDDLLNVVDNENGLVSVMSKSEARNAVRSNPNRYALAGQVTGGGDSGNWINMVGADGEGEPISVRENSPQHRAAVSRGMVEAGPLSLNTRDPLRDRRVNEYVSTYGVDRPTAIKLADGLVKPFTDPMSGQTYFFDMVTQSAVTPSVGGGARRPGVGAPQAASAPQSEPPAVPGGNAPPVALPRPMNADPMTTPLLGLVDVFGGKQPLQSAAGKLSMGSYDAGRGVNIPLQRYQLMKQDIFNMNGGADRMSNQDRERIEKAFPSDGVFESSARAFDMLETLAHEAQGVVRTQQSIAADETKPAQMRREAEAKIIAAEKVLRTIGNPGEFQRPGVAGGAQVAKPISQMNIEELEALDERSLSTSQLLEVVQRERQLRGGR